MTSRRWLFGAFGGRKEANGVVNTLIKVVVNGCTAVGAKMGRGAFNRCAGRIVSNIQPMWISIETRSIHFDKNGKEER